MPRRREFAQDTSVSVEKSKIEIEKLVSTHGAEGFHTGWQGGSADGVHAGWDAVEFLWKGKTIRFKLERPRASWSVPDPKDPTKQVTKRAPWAVDKWGYLLKDQKLVQAIDQKNRQRWRVLYLVIKAKLEAVAAGVVVFEEEFLPFIVFDGSRTIGEVLVPRVQAGVGGRLLLAAPTQEAGGAKGAT
jgi:hypothetical protein